MHSLEVHYNNGIVAVGPLVMYDLSWMQPSLIEEDIQGLVVTWAKGTPRERITTYAPVKPHDYGKLFPAYSGELRIPNSNIVYFANNVFERVSSRLVGVGR